MVKDSECTSLTNQLNMRFCWYLRFTMMEETWGHPRLICQCQPCQPSVTLVKSSAVWSEMRGLKDSSGLSFYMLEKLICWRKSLFFFKGFSHMGSIHSKHIPSYPIFMLIMLASSSPFQSSILDTISKVWEYLNRGPMIFSSHGFLDGSTTVVLHAQLSWF